MVWCVSPPPPSIESTRPAFIFILSYCVYTGHAIYTVPLAGGELFDYTCIIIIYMIIPHANGQAIREYIYFFQLRYTLVIIHHARHKSMHLVSETCL